MAFQGFTQGSVYEVQVGKPSKGYDWDTKPSEYNKDRMKPLPAYKMPEAKDSMRKKILNDKPYTEYPGEVASDTPGRDWERIPQVYETHRMKGKTNDPRFKLDPFKSPTVYNQVSNFKEHFAIQDSLHPFRNAFDDLPQIFAKKKQEEDERALRGMQPVPPAPPAPMVGPVDPNNPILRAARERYERIGAPIERARDNPIPFDDEDLQIEAEFMKTVNMLDDKNPENRFSDLDILMARDRLRNVAVRGPRPARPEDPLHASMREARMIREQMNKRRTDGTPGIIDHVVPQWVKQQYMLDHNKEYIEHYQTDVPIRGYAEVVRPRGPQRNAPKPSVDQYLELFDKSLPDPSQIRELSNNRVGPGVRDILKSYHNTENVHKHSELGNTPNDAYAVVSDRDIVRQIRDFPDMIQTPNISNRSNIIDLDDPEFLQDANPYFEQQLAALDDFIRRDAPDDRYDYEDSVEEDVDLPDDPFDEEATDEELEYQYELDRIVDELFEKKPQEQAFTLTQMENKSNKKIAELFAEAFEKQNSSIADTYRRINAVRENENKKTLRTFTLKSVLEYVTNPKKYFNHKIDQRQFLIDVITPMQLGAAGAGKGKKGKRKKGKHKTVTGRGRSVPTTHTYFYL
jgi:hypothetical protein